MIFEISSGAKIHLLNKPNAHVLYIGKSGSGKTYAICRQMEELISVGKRIMILDWSGSYSVSELKKSDFSLPKDSIQIIDLKTQKVRFNVMTGDADDSDRIASLGENALGIKGDLQKDILQKATAGVNGEGVHSMAEIQLNLKKQMKRAERDKEFELARRISKVMDRWQKLSKHDCIDLWDSDGIVPDTEKVVIIQLSSLPLVRRKICMLSVLWILWELTEQGKMLFDTLVMDEIQHVDFTADIPSRMVRQGRKYGLGLLMSTQFLAGMDATSVSTVLEAGNAFYFQQDSANARSVANRISFRKPEIWAEKLHSLDVGEAVLRGCYTVNHNKSKNDKLIVVKHGKGGIGHETGRNSDVGR